jgi:hypothetical protein
LRLPPLDGEQSHYTNGSQGVGRWLGHRREQENSVISIFTSHSSDLANIIDCSCKIKPQWKWRTHQISQFVQRATAVQKCIFDATTKFSLSNDLAKIIDSLGMA